MPEDSPNTPKRYRLMGADGRFFDSPVPGQIAGNRKLKTYGQLNCGLPDCGFPDKGHPEGSPKIRVFFADEETAISAGYRPCGGCMPQRYKQWKEGAKSAGPDYPWLIKSPQKP